MRDLGALPHDVDMAGVVRDLGLDKPALDPTKLDADELLAEFQRVTTGALRPDGGAHPEGGCCS
jgi:hypothetical protein